MSEVGPIETLLAWYVGTGADEAIGEEPRSRFVEPALSVAPMPAAAAPAAAPVAEAATLAELAEAVAAFEGCALKRTAHHTVFADGNPESGLMLIGEAPGAEEDRIGRPFVGAAGRLLDRMLAAIGRDRSGAYITNVVFWRPPDNRKPSDAEIAACRPFVLRHIALVRPRLVVLVGGTASTALIPGSEGITRLRGRRTVVEVPGLTEPVQAIAMYHPSFLLRTPARKREAWSDLLSIKSMMESVLK
jgi:DNA polymerase